MAKDKQNLRCTECRNQLLCSDVNEGIEKFICKFDNGPVSDSCKVNLQLDGKSVFEINQLIGKKEKKSDAKDSKESDSGKSKK